MDKATRDASFKKLMDIAQAGSIPLYAYAGDHYKGGRNWPVEWENDLIYCHFRTKSSKKYALNKALEHILNANCPSSIEQVDKERKLTRLILDAGADPNFDSTLHDGQIFDKFLLKKKTHIALEIAKTDGFMGPQNPENTFAYLSGLLRFYLQWGKPYPGDTKEEANLIARDCSDQKDLVYHLFQKGLYPRDEKVFQDLTPIILEKDPDFFDKKRKQVISQMQRAKTPLQIYKILTGQGKEKS